ncbi:phosphodiesterase [Candidatus Halocynthiibacter alkanivorans]|uniref:phosphodiesterase n=1 Tax=Candidatus Halocynthiibacter alkanivorans TaxID=2267619 RepID=UPI001F281840|nr:phosphodiesterase [Candidatus Halocynthiibacter alkanivorans]
MLKTVWMSDPHFSASGDVLGHDPGVRLAAAVDHVNAHYGDSDLCILSGDLVNRGNRRDYQALKQHLDRLSVPYFPMAGNHDDRPLLREVLPLPEGCMAEFIQYTITTAEGLLICLDTQKTGADGGEFCAARMRWLARELDRAGDTPVFLFMHHPPMRLGLPMQDSANMENGAAFLDLLQGYPNIRHLFIGHVHRPVSGTVRGIAFATMRSVLYQAPPPRPAWDWDSFHPAQEAPEFGVLCVENADVTLQYVQFCPFETGGPEG